MSVHTVKVTLRGVRPPVWRRLEVPSTLTRGQLDDVLGVAFAPRSRPGGDGDPTPLQCWMPHEGDVADHADSADRLYQIQVEAVSIAAVECRAVRCLAGAGFVGRRAGVLDPRDCAEIDSQLAALDFASEVRSGGPDPAFSGVLPTLLDDVGVCACGCGQRADGLPPLETLPLYRPEPDDVLAGLAAGSPLVRRAVALATWLGPGRPVTGSAVLKPADALAAVAACELDRPLLPAPEEDDEFPGPAPRRLRSAKDLPALHPLWVAAVAAGLIDVRGGRARPGPALAAWRGPAVPRARIESWAALLGAFLRYRDEAAVERCAGLTELDGQMLPATAPLLYASARDAVPVGALAVTLADVLDGDDPPISLFTLPLLIGEVSQAVEDWVIAGVLEVVPDADRSWVVPDGPLGELVTRVQDELADAEAQPHLASQLFEPLLDVIEEGPFVRMTPLGRYGLARLLTAHGWDVPFAGDCAPLAPAELLDRLVAWGLEDALSEASAWIDARGEAWEQAVRDAAWSAAAPGAAGPGRRSVLPLVLQAAGSRVLPLLSELEHDPWLAAPVALARHLLGAGEAPSLEQRMWWAIDQLSVVVDERTGLMIDRDEFEDLVEDTGLFELVAEPSGAQAAARLRHPRTGDVLRTAVPFAPDGTTARALRQALEAAAGGGRAGGRLLRSVGGRSDRRRP